MRNYGRHHPCSSRQCNPAEEELEAQLHMLMRFPRQCLCHFITWYQRRNVTLMLLCDILSPIKLASFVFLHKQHRVSVNGNPPSFSWVKFCFPFFFCQWTVVAVRSEALLSLRQGPRGAHWAGFVLVLNLCVGAGDYSKHFHLSLRLIACIL